MLKSIIKQFENMNIFHDVDNIPDIPIVDDDIYINVIIPNLIRCGAIKKSDLIVGAKYLGSCRNSDTAVWNGNKFIYQRTKFGYTYTESINHFEDDDGYDVFVPIKLIDN